MKIIFIVKSPATNFNFNFQQLLYKIYILQMSLRFKNSKFHILFLFVPLYLFSFLSLILPHWLLMTRFPISTRRYLYTSEDYVKSGALLAIGLVNCGIRNECDPAFALLSEYVSSSSQTLRIGAVLGLGLAYAGSRRKDVTELLSAALTDEKSEMNNFDFLLQFVPFFKQGNFILFYFFFNNYMLKKIENNVLIAFRLCDILIAIYRVSFELKIFNRRE